MSRQFSIPTVLRMVPNELLQQCFERLGHSDFDPRWADLKQREIDPILDYLGELPREQLDEIESVLRSVFDLACPSGLDALLEAGPHSGAPDLASLMPDGLCNYGSAMWAWLNHRKVFDKAQTIYQVEHMSWWRKRNDLPKNAPDKSSEAIEKLETDISTLLKSQGRGKDCTVEILTRGNMDYFSAYPDDFIQNVTVHDEDGKLAPQVFRQTLLVVFAYNRAEGTLETFAKLPKKLKERLEVIFADAILHWKLGPHEPKAVYELNQLKEPAFDLNPDPADYLRIKIHKMRLSAKYSGRRLLVEVDDEDPDDNIHKAIDECVNLETVPLSEWNATQATFCFEFLPITGRKHGQQTFDVSYPRSCSLRDARPERVELIQKYLKLWNIDRVATPEPSPVAMGD
jgi:hypothetical protein